MVEINLVLTKLELRSDWDKIINRGMYWDFSHPIMIRDTVAATSHSFYHVA